MRRPLYLRYISSLASQLQGRSGFAHELLILHAHLSLPGSAPLQYVILAESRDTRQA